MQRLATIYTLYRRQTDQRQSDATSLIKKVITAE